MNNKINLSENELKEMFEIIFTNMNGISPINDSKDKIYSTWKTNILKNNELKTCILKDNKVYAYIQYIVKNNTCCICEIEINKNYQKDKKTFRKLIELLIINANITNETLIYGNINPNNEHSIDVFTNLGFINTQKNKYEIKGSNLIKWALNKKQTI